MEGKIHRFVFGKFVKTCRKSSIIVLYTVCMNLWKSVLHPDVGIFLQKLTYPGQKTPHLNIWEIKHDGKIDPIMGRSNKNDFHTLVGCHIWMQIKLVVDSELVCFGLFLFKILKISFFKLPQCDFVWKNSICIKVLKI